MRRQSKSNATKPRSCKPAAIKRHRTPASRHQSDNRSGQSIDQLRRELDEARKQQTATTDVLRIVSASSDEVKPVFQAILINAVRICEAKFANLSLCDGEAFRAAAFHNVPPEYAEVRLRQPWRPHPRSGVAKVVRTKQPVQIDDVRTSPAYLEGDWNVRAIVDMGGARTLLLVPMLKDKDNVLVGLIGIYHKEVRPFTDRQIALVQNFAAQAVIAIENARLLNELRQRTDDLSESLEQQTATSEVLGIISSSPGELQPVFQAILVNAIRLCSATFGTLNLCDGEALRYAAHYNIPPEYRDFRLRERLWRPHPRSATAEALRTKQPIQIDDLRTLPAYLEGDPIDRAVVDMGGARTLIVIPMLKDDKLIGTITIFRQEVHPFTDKQIALVQNFAAQAVIAIENTRLLNELKQSLERQTATADVLRVISASPGELEPVFNAMLGNATRICEAKFGTLILREGDNFRVVAFHNAPPAYVELRTREPLVWPFPGAAWARAIATKGPVQIADVTKVSMEDPGRRSFIALTGARTFITVPMLKDNEGVGTINVYRQEVRPFTDKQVEVLTNFAAQAVIAIENARLLNELRQRTADLTESLDQQTATSQVLSIISSSPAELAPVFQAILANATRLCGAAFGGLSLYDGEVLRYAAHYNIPPEYTDFRLRERLWRPHPRSTMAEALRTKKPVQANDLRTSPAYLEGDSTLRAIVDMGGARTLILIPMLKDEKLVGVVAIYRQEVRPFTDKQIALVQNFAAQAVIAIENARLLRELNREREALARQHQADARYISWLRQLAGFLRHEVRQPVAQINSSVELIHLTSHDEQLKPYIASASQGVGHVWNLIERASRATDAEAFVRQGQAQPIDLPRLLRQLIGSYQQTHSGIDFRLQLPDKEPLSVSADPTLLKEAFSNLLANAASFVDEEGIVHVVLERDGAHAVIKVRNKGPIIQYDPEMLFGPFASTRSSPSSEHQGLGLYLVRLVAEHHGGKAIISNLDDGSGVEASIFLPL